MALTVTADLRRALRDRYPPPDWFMAYEVQAPRDEGGLRFADAIAFDTRKGAGMAVHGFELKVSRADWLHEVKDPSKAGAARALCDYWWVVAGAPDIVRVEELPIGAGLLVADRIMGLAVQVQARGRPTREPLDRALFAAFLRRLDPMEPRAYYDGKVRDAERKGIAKGRNEAGRLARKRDRAGVVEEPAQGGNFCP